MTRKLINLLIGTLLCGLPLAAARADGAVYAMTNALGNNQVLVYHRASDGVLKLVQTIATGGGGSGLQLGGIDSLGSAGSVQLDANHHLLFVVNTETTAANNGAGTYNQDCNIGSITSFVVAADGKLTFASKVASGGLFPDSLAVKTLPAVGRNPGFQPGQGPASQPGDVIYALNAGGPGIPACQKVPSISGKPNITGFTVDSHGVMTRVGTVLASAQAINPGPASGTGENCSGAVGFMGLTGAPAADFQCGLNPPSFPRSPAQVKFTPAGDQLVVSVKGTNTIYVFPIDQNGRAGNPTVTQAPGPGIPSYFGMTFDRQAHLVITELFGTATSIPHGAAGAVSTFTITKAGQLFPISKSVSDGGTAACWIALDPASGKFAYVANNLSNGISSYKVASDGSVSLLQAVAAAGSGPNDLAVALEGGNSFLYVVNAGNGTVGAFKIRTNGALTTLLPTATGLPAAGAQGIAAY